MDANSIINFVSVHLGQQFLYYLTVVLGCAIAQMFSLWKDYSGKGNNQSYQR